MPKIKVETYDLHSRINHWVIGLAMFVMVAVGLYLEFGSLERSDKRFLMGIHKSAGVLILIFGLWRVFWRIKQGFPNSVTQMSAKEKLASKLAHYLLLISIILMPLSGIFSSIFRGRSVDVFGFFIIPAQSKVQWLASLAKDTHTYAGRALAILIVIHIAAALKHHFYNKDKTLSRMLKG